MKCPRCGVPSAVVETREGESLTTKRKRKCFNNHIFHTTELHNAAAVSAKQRAVTFAATVKKRIAMWKRDRLISARLHFGWQTLAKEFGLTKAAVYLAAQRGRK